MDDGIVACMLLHDVEGYMSFVQHTYNKHVLYTVHGLGVHVDR